MDGEIKGNPIFQIIISVIVLLEIPRTRKSRLYTSSLEYLSELKKLN